ncbi:MULTISPECIES: LCP family protein [Corynebacterium]|uniref:LCP family protein n=1 Tax=Corynebacterium TaxID=1716 RepID=UPI0005575ED3|nr:MULTISPECIES: LCP family protein [Corynebacterium]MDK8869809.1 LCP family protein [Corynebacterium macclintockiae]OFM58304.1 LytR family transcriptional regulator [Corynebacterium sp. HMSC058E07]
MTEHERGRHSRRIQAAPGGREAKQIGSRLSRGVVAAVSALSLVVMGIGYMAVGNLNDGLAQADNLNLGNQPDGATDILLVGVDSRTDAKGNPLSQQEIDMLRAGEEEATNTDTMILIRIPNDGSSATAVSLPRDTYVRTRDYGNMKLNGVYGTAKFEKSQELSKNGETNKSEVDKKSTEAGRQALISSVADLTGINVDHYAEVGLLGFVLLTDAVGGVDVCLKNKVDEPLSGAKFKAGRQTLTGQDALSFVRQRHELPRGDLDRITRQQAYMASLANHVLSSKTLTDPGSMSKLNNAVQRSVVLDSGWDVMGLATQMQNMAGGDVSFQTIPVTSIDGTGDYGESVVTVDTDQVHKFFKELLGDKPGEEEPTSDKPADITDYKAGDYKVNVFNASEQAGLAARVSELAKQYGYKSGKVGNHPETGVSESQVNAKNADDPAARALAKQLGGLPVVQDSSLDEHELSVTLSGTYAGPGILEQSAPLTKPDDPNVGTLTEGMKDLDGDGIPDETTSAGTTADSTSTAAKPSTVGTPGTGQGTDRKDPIDAGGDGPMCVN